MKYFVLFQIYSKGIRMYCEHSFRENDSYFSGRLNVDFFVRSDQLVDYRFFRTGVMGNHKTCERTDF